MAAKKKTAKKKRAGTVTVKDLIEVVALAELCCRAARKSLRALDPAQKIRVASVKAAYVPTRVPPRMVGGKCMLVETGRMTGTKLRSPFEKVHAPEHDDRRRR